MENNLANEMSNVFEPVTQNEAVAIFCRKCGNKLVSGVNVCDVCGTWVVKKEGEDRPFDNEEYEASKLSLKKRKRKKFIKILLLILFATVLAVGGFFVSKLIVKHQDINAINGCPEFYKLEFGMTAYEASDNIKLKNTAINGTGENSLFGADDVLRNSSILIEDGEVFYLYGKKAEDVYVGFDETRLDSVIFRFSKDKYTLADIVTLYERIYGEATKTESIYSTWIGTKTTIDVFDYTFDDGDSEIVVRYIITPNSQYEALSFDGSELDPCGFLSNNYAFNKEPEYYTDGLEEGEDFNKEVYSPEGFPGFSKYTLYPKFEYMGIKKGYTAVEFDVGEEKDTIETASYLFLLSEENVVDRMTYIHAKLSEKYGKEDSSTYTSTNYNDLGIKDVSFSEMKKRFEKGTEGLYHVQWKAEGRNINLRLTISVDMEYYEGAVSFTD